jgi:hypothetical protein
MNEVKMRRRQWDDDEDEQEDAAGGQGHRQGQGHPSSAVKSLRGTVMSADSTYLAQEQDEDIADFDEDDPHGDDEDEAVPEDEENMREDLEEVFLKSRLYGDDSQDIDDNDTADLK